MSDEVRPHPGQEVISGWKFRIQRVCRIFLHTSTSSDLFAPGSGVIETLIVSPIPCCKSNHKAIELETIPLVEPPASVRPR